MTPARSTNHIIIRAPARKIHDMDPRRPPILALLARNSRRGILDYVTTHVLQLQPFWKRDISMCLVVVVRQDTKSWDRSRGRKNQKSVENEGIGKLNGLPCSKHGPTIRSFSDATCNQAMMIVVHCITTKQATNYDIMACCDSSAMTSATTALT